MIRRPRFVVASESLDWSAIWPSGAWRESFTAVGGSLESGAGVRAGYVVRRDHLCTVPVRLEEVELADFYALMRAAHAGAEVTWYPDADELASIAVHLVSPTAADTIRPEPDPDYPSIMTVDLVFRRADGARFLLDWWAGT